MERRNLTMRMGMRRFTRLTNAFSKKIENHVHAVTLHFFHYNFCRPHQGGGREDHARDGRRVESYPWSPIQLCELLEDERRTVAAMAGSGDRSLLQLVDRKLQAALLDTQMGFRAATQATPGIATDKERAELFSVMIDVHSAVLRDAALENARTFSGASPNWNVTDSPRPGYQR